MRSCAASRRRPGRAAAALALLAGFVAAAGPAAAMTLEELLRGMASAPGVHARFLEVRDVSLLSEPIESEGEIFFAPPRRFARITERPSPSRFVVDGDRLSFRDAAGEQTLSAAGSRVARAIVENFIVLWSGDAEGLAARYDIEFSGEGGGWRLQLRPKDSAVAGVVERVVLVGEGTELREMRLEEPGGDRTVTRYRDVRVAPLTEADLSRAFSGEAAP